MHKFLLITLFTLLSSNLLAQESSSEEKHFDIMADYLSRDGGKWTSQNPNHDPNNPRSAKAYGLWFERPLQNMMTLSIVAYVGDTVYLSSQGIFSWHPIEKHYVHVNSDRGYGYSEGVTSFLNDSTFISTMTDIRANGKTTESKDENFVVSANVHRNTSYSKQNGQWVKRGEYVWRRDSEKDQ